MGTNVRAINADKRQLYFSVLAGFLEQQLDNLLQNAVFLIIPESVIYAPVWRIVTRQVPPGSAGTKYPEDAVKHLSDLCRLPSSRWRVGNQRFNGLELVVGEGVSSHAILL